jgi:hypothetical protein
MNPILAAYHRLRLAIDNSRHQDLVDATRVLSDDLREAALNGSYPAPALSLLTGAVDCVGSQGGRVSISLTRVHSEAAGLRVRALLEGRSYMSLRVTVCPAGGGFEVWVDGSAETQLQLREMVTEILLEEACARL